jgi:hypothetical protein
MLEYNLFYVGNISVPTFSVKDPRAAIMHNKIFLKKGINLGSFELSLIP